MVSSCGTRDGAHGTLCRALDPAKKNIYALESLNRYIVSGCRELKRKFRLSTADQIRELLRKRRGDEGVRGDVTITVDQSTGKTKTETKKPAEKKPKQESQ